MGTKTENQSQSDTDKQDLNEFNALATAMQAGNMDEVNRLMAVEDKVEEPEIAPEEEETPTPEDDSVEEEAPEEEVEETPEETDEDDKTPEDPAKGAKDTKVAAKAATPDKIDTELEELKQKLHRAQSDAGRVPYLQRQLTELQRELRAQRARATEDASQGKKPTTVGRIEDVELDPETQEKIDNLRTIDPVMADALERSTKASIFHSNSRVEHAVTTLTEEDQRAEDQRFYIEQKSILTQRVPQADQIFASPEWSQWKEMLTPGQRALAESAYANEVEQAIYAFAQDMKRLNGQPAASTQTEQPEPPVQEVTEVEKARERKKSGAVESKTPTARTTKPFDEQAIFEQFYNDIGKKDNILPR